MMAPTNKAAEKDNEMHLANTAIKESTSSHRRALSIYLPKLNLPLLQAFRKGRDCL